MKEGPPWSLISLQKNTVLRKFDFVLLIALSFSSAHRLLLPSNGTHFVIRHPVFIMRKNHSYMVLKPGGGEKSSERKAAIFPAPGAPTPFLAASKL